MPLAQPNRDIIKKSLVYYFQTLVKLSNEVELTEISKVDLLNECRIIAMARDEMERFKDPTQSYTYKLDIQEYNRAICSALKCYLKDLEKSMEKISGVHDDAKIPLSLTNTDLQLVNEALTKIPDCEHTPDENE
jgi:hypothetical protein